LLKTHLDERLNRALTAFLRQEVQAPATAITDFLDMIIEDARTAQAENLLADLNRMRSASVQLNAFVKNLIQDSSSDRRQDDETLEAFHRRLRHDLRTPLNAIKGYSELLIEDLEAAGAHPLLADLAKLKASADQLLEQIDAMTALARQKQAEPVELSKVRQLDVVADVLRSLEPLPASAKALGALHSSRILVVDDNASNRDVLERRLTREGHQVACAANGAAALELVVRQEFDLILLDLIMPEMSGFEVLRRLKAAEHTNHIPVIVISALDDLDSAVRCIEAGAEDYLTKPFNPILLRARIGASLERKRLRDREKKFVADLEREKERSEALLLNILPQGIVNRMRNRHCRPGRRGDNSVLRRRRVHNTQRGADARPHDRLPQQDLLRLRPPGGGIQSGEDQDHRRRLHGRRRDSGSPIRSRRPHRRPGAAHARSGGRRRRSDRAEASGTHRHPYRPDRRRCHRRTQIRI
jgi:adenylate cyclase